MADVTKKNGDVKDARTQDPNEGEGNKTAARHYNDATEKYAKSGKVDEAAHKAEEAIDGEEGDELRAAEEEGKKHVAARDHGMTGTKV